MVTAPLRTICCFSASTGEAFHMALGRDPNPLHNRDPGFKDVDIAAISAIAQAAIDVELFTIPLYMTSLYSIQGMHQITSQGNDFYKGRLWPGPAPSADPKTANEKAFNIIFSLFIQEMLHLQLASNIATAIGVTPTYTGPALQNADHGWICYGPTLTVIPYIIDLKDTKEHKDVVVNIGPVSEDQLKLFLAIEEPEKVATTSTPTSSTNTSRSHPSSIGGRNNRCQCSARSAGCTSATRTISKSNTATAARCGRRCTALARRKARSRTTCSTTSSPAAIRCASSWASSRPSR